MPTVSAYHVGAGERFNYHQKLPLQFPPDLEVTNSEASVGVPSTDIDSQNPLMGRELVKGGSGGKEEKGITNPKDLKPIPEICNSMRRSSVSFGVAKKAHAIHELGASS